MMAKRYGVPYMGSKNDIAEDVISCLPAGEVFYDLFAGGCAVTHAAMLSGKYKRFVANDIDWRGITLFRDAVAGKYHNEKRLIDREYFHANKETDAYVALCWSFGNDGKSYLYGEDVEGLKLGAQRMIMAGTWQERLRFYRDFIKKVAVRLVDINRPHEIQSLERLLSLERLESLQRLEGSRRLECLIGDYRSVNISGGGGSVLRPAI